MSPSHLPQADSSSDSLPSSAKRSAVEAAGAASRRRWITLGVGALAALGGVGLASWRMQGGGATQAAPQNFWQTSFEGPAGETVQMAALRGRPLLLNFWATWCPPCVEELPMLNRFYGEHRAKGWQVLGLAIDQPSNVRRFLQRLPLDFPTVLGGLAGTDLARSLGNQKGGLPFTVLFDTDGGILKRKIGQLTTQDLQDWARLM